MSSFDQSVPFFTNMSISNQTFDFWPKYRFWPKFRFLTKMSIFDQMSIFPDIEMAGYPVKDIPEVTAILRPYTSFGSNRRTWQVRWRVSGLLPVYRAQAVGCPLTQAHRVPVILSTLKIPKSGLVFGPIQSRCQTCRCRDVAKGRKKT